MSATIEALIEGHRLPAAYRGMVEQVHRPLAMRIVQRRRSLGRPIVVGLCGSQGSGKSTMAAFLKALVETEGLSAAVLSIDDLYLPREARERLARDTHPLLLTRGVPGTHDPDLGLALLDVLGAGPAEVSLPRFDKAEDTRAPASAWPVVGAPVDVVLLEGWCVGAIPQPEQALALPVNALEREEDADGAWRRYVNDQLKGRYAELFARIDLLALLEAPSFEVVFGWRSLQEEKLAERVRREGLTGTRVMGPAEIRRFLMFYQRLTEWILEEMPGRAEVVMPLDEAHRILGIAYREQP